MQGYGVVFEHEILFRDIDAMGHVNNVTFVAFMEDARMKYWKALRQKTGLKKINFILAEVRCIYKSPAYLGETLRIGIRACRLGGKSFHFEYRMEESKSGRLVVEGSSIQVMYDYQQQQSVQIDEATRQGMAAIEGVPLESLQSRNSPGS